MRKQLLLLTALSLALLAGCDTPENKDSELPVRKACSLERLYADMPQDIRQDTPDIAFVNALCAGKVDEVVGLFREKKLFWDEAPAVDTPYELYFRARPHPVPQAHLQARPLRDG